MPPLSGTTRLYAVLGDPVDQVRAPALLNPYFAEHGLDAVLFPVHVTPDRLAETLRGLAAIRNLDGLLVTVPHKIAICAHLDELAPAAALVGSANAVRRTPGGGLRGDNFDGAGFVRGLDAAGHPVAGATVALAGAGGAGIAVAAALLAAGAARLSAGDPDPARRSALRAALETRWPGRVTAAATPDLTAADLAVNATPLGLRPGDPLPFDPGRLPAHAVVADIVMRPARTTLLRHATALGLRTHRGIHMLTQQLALYAEFFGFAQSAAARPATS